MTITKLGLALTLAGITVVLAASQWTHDPVRAADGMKCYSDWSVAGPVLRAEKLANPSDVRATAEKALDGRLLRMNLCQVGSDYKFRLVLVGAEGAVKTVLVDARKPFAN